MHPNTFSKNGFAFHLRFKHKLHCFVLYRADGAFECRTTS